MADDEQFSLCWNNFNSNLSAGFHESLCRGDLVDVTLAAEGQFVKAHRLVLSVCSPYFRKMFTQMPANQHAFVFLKDVSHTALKDLIQFMYCGEVNVKQEALPAFISTAEALQIKGLTDSDPPPSQSPAKPSTPAPQPTPIQQITSPRVRQRTSTSRSYKIEAIDDSVEDKQATQIVIQTAPQQAQTTIVQQPQHHHQTQHSQPQQSANTVTTTTTNISHKRPAQRSVGGTIHSKRTKSTIDPLEASETTPSSQQISVQTVVAESKQPQQQSEPEFIDLPIELPTKSEPDYTEETGEVETAEQETTYVEDDSYGDMRYDESYFTENEDAANTGTTGVGGNMSGAGATTSKAIVKQQAFSDSSYTETADQTNNEAQESLVTPISTPVRRRGRPKQKQEDDLPQEKLIDKITAAVANNTSQPTVYASTTKGGMKLIYNGHHFKYSFRKGQYSIFQCCYKENKEQCKVRVVSNQKRVFHLDGEHVHFIQATDKSVTSVMFETGECNEDVPMKTDDQNVDKIDAVEESAQEKCDSEIISETSVEKNLCDDSISSGDLRTEVDANDFREKIKKRLQKALLGKKK